MSSPDDSEANPLKNWQKWLQEREKLQNYLGNCLDRRPEELLMNLNEELRLVNEEKTLIDYTKIQTKFDYYRGNPNFWRLPLELHNKKDPSGRSFLFISETVKDKGVVPMLERVGIPKKISQEKHVYPRTRSIWNQWSDLEYRQLRLKALKDKIETIQPHYPDFENLIVEGRRAALFQTESKGYSEQTCEIRDVTYEEKSEETRSDQIKQPKVERTIKSGAYLSLTINGFNFMPNELNTTKVFLIAFGEVNTQSKKLVTRYLSIENNSSVPLRISFKRIEQYNLFHDLIPKRQKGVVFFFGRDDLILNAGQKQDYPFRFKASRPGNYEEKWEIQTIPKMWEPPAKVLLKLIAFADTISTDQLNKISEDLEKSVRERLVKDTISELLYNVETRGDHVGILYHYDQALLFETINSQITPYHNNPKYKYNEIVVEKFKNLYNEVREDSDPINWNYSIHDLHLMVLHHDLKSNDDESKMKELDDLLTRLEPPTIEPCNTNNLYFVFFSFLYASFTQICDEIFKLQEDLGIIYQPRYPDRFASTLKVNNLETTVNNRKPSKEGSIKKLRKDSRGSSQRLLKKNSFSKRKKSKETSTEDIHEEIEQVVCKVPDYLSSQFSHNLYVIFYTNLCKAVDAIEMAITSKEEIIPHRSIKRLEECETFSKEYYNTNVVSLKNLISEILLTEAETTLTTEMKTKQHSNAGVTSSYPTRLISYPEIFFQPFSGTKPEMEKRSTSTLEGGIIDMNWLQFKEVEAQTCQVSSESDLIQEVEILQDATSLQDIEYCREVACQKNADEHVSDEEYFYGSSGDEK